MTEITRVPLQPIAKGSGGKIWRGLAALALAAGGLAAATLPDSVKVETLTAGTGKQPAADEVAVINYVGKLKDGKVFDQGREAPLPLAQVVPGFREGITQMKTGGKYRLTIPAAKGYGAKEQRNPQTGEVAIPANSDLVFDIDLLATMTEAEFQQMMQMQQMMQQQRMQQQQGKGAPAAGPEGMPALPEGVAPPR
jgi:FKBP-type peptidyl-prolyl cis-trans isomerase FkpA